MKKNVLVGVIAVLLVLGIGISFAYFVSGVLVSGKGSDVTLEPGDMFKVEYDAGSSKLVGNKLMPGDSVSKDFSVTITPTETEKEVMYGIFINLINNTFVKCDDHNYDELTNACEKGAKEITYTIKDKDTNRELARGDLTGKSGKVKLLTEEKEVESKTVFNYTITITFEDTGKDQNHNQNKGIEGNIEVEFTELTGSEYILSHYDTILTRNDFSTTVKNTTTGTIYKSLNESQYDEDGEVYYFAGAPTDNYVKFAGFYWRIIRINGDGSIRLIYNGTDTTQTGESTMIDGSQSFNSSYDRSQYDREVANGYEWSTTGSTHNYAGYERLVTNKTPMLKCGNNADLYTIGGSSKGNHALTNPIGLITADEVAMAGGVYGNVNNNYYLYNGEHYWTMTPSKYPDANVFYVWSNGSFSHANVASMYGVRPVINLAHDLEITGSGTSSDPFVVKGAE